MTHFTLRRGRFFPLETWVPARNGAAPLERGASRVWTEPIERDELAFFGLCLQSPREDPHVELARFALVDEHVDDSRRSPFEKPARSWEVADDWPPM